MTESFKVNETVHSLKKRIDVTPTRSTVESIVGKDGIRDHPDGTWDADLKGKQVQQWLEARRPRARLDAERGAELNAGHDNVTLRDRDGRERRPAGWMADSVGRKFGLSRRSFNIPILDPGWTWRCERGHLFGFVRGPRPGSTECLYCDGLALAEPA